MAPRTAQDGSKAGKGPDTQPARGKPVSDPAKAPERHPQLRGWSDPEGLAFQAAIDAVWAEAVESSDTPDEAVRKYKAKAPALPAFHERAAIKLDREVLGRFAYDPTSDTLHDMHNATPACRIPAAPAPLMFVHFAHELEGVIPPTATLHSCMEA